MTERKIRWESYHLNGRFDGKGEKDEILANLDPEDEDDELIKEEILNAPKLVDSPYGLLEISDELNPLNRFNHYMLHTNFNITEKEFVIVNFCPGVVSVMASSRYSILLGIAPLFDEVEVKREIERLLINIEDYPNALFQTQKEVLLMN